MIQELEEKQLLKDYASKYNIYELTSEDIIKLIMKPYLMKEIATSFGITEKEFNDIKKQKGIKNSILEDIVRNIETILHHIDSKNKYISKTVREEIINILIQTLTIKIPKKQFYIKKLSETDFSRKKVIDDLIIKEIDIDYRLKSLSDLVTHIENTVNNLIEKEKKYLLKNNNKKLYNQLNEKKKLGKSFNKKDLTYDILFELSIIENVPDSSIGELYNLNTNQIRYLRKKYGFSNILKAKLQNYPETFMYYAEKNNKIPKDISIYEYEQIMVDLIKKISTDTTINIKDKEQSSDDIIVNIDNKPITYHVFFSDEKYSVQSKSINKKGNGARHNHKKENETKRLHGKIGEQIALEAEKMRLTKLGLKDLAKDVKLIAQIDEETTLDGLGYDLISFNENREKIFIEVKTSYGNKDKPFFISKKELDLIQGLKAEYNCKNCLIYYIRINEFDVTIKDIHPIDFNTMKLTPILYKVE